MAVKNKQAHELIEKLEKAGLLSQIEKNNILYMDGFEGKEITEKDVLEFVNTGDMRKTDWDAYTAIVEDQGLKAGEWNPDIRSKSLDFMSGLMSNEVIGNIAKYGTPAVGYYGPKAVIEPGLEKIGELAGDAGISFGMSTEKGLRKAYLSELSDLGYEIPYANLASFGNAEDISSYLMDKYDIPPTLMRKVSEQVEGKIKAKLLAEKETSDNLDKAEEIDDINEANPQYAKNLRAFEILDKASPTKYRFDEATGAIWNVEAVTQVDRRGQLIDTTIESEAQRAADLVGGWGEGGEPDWFQLKVDNQYETGWEKLGREMGFEVDENSYLDVLDVIKNKQGYGADPSRYLTGGDFLGGFDQGYRVSVAEGQAQRKFMDAANSGSLPNFSQARYDDLLTGAIQETRRPWYDPDDEWALFAGQSPENIRSVQEFLVRVGALEGDEVVDGTWGTAEATQMRKVLFEANGRGLQWTDISEEDLKANFDSETARTSPSRAAFVPEPYRPMDPARVEVTVRDSVRQLLGRDPTAQDFQELGGYLVDQYSSSYEADVSAARAQYSARISADESGAEYIQPGAVEDVDWEARYVNKMEEKFAPQLASQKRGVQAGQQQDMGVAMSNLMSKLGGGIG